MRTLLQQQPFFTLNHGKSPSPTKGKEPNPVPHEKEEGRKIRAVNPTAFVCDMQDWNCRCLVSHTEYQQSTLECHNSDHVRMHSASCSVSPISQQECGVVQFSNLLVPSGSGTMQKKIMVPSLFCSADSAKALGNGASLPQFCVCENWGMRYWRCLFLAEISCVLRNSEAWRAICLERRINFQSHQPVRDVLEEHTEEHRGVSVQGWPNSALVLKTAKLYTTARLYS